MKEQLIKHRYDVTIVVLLLLQICLLLLDNATYYLGIEGSSFSFFFSGLFVGILTIAKFKNRKAEIHYSNSDKQKLKMFLWIASIVVLLGLIPFIIKMLQTTPTTLAHADIIPTLKELCERFFDGSNVYRPIEKFGYHLPVTYLPMQWMPYLLAEKFTFDYRWTSVTVTFIVFLILTYRSFKTNSLRSHVTTLIMLAAAYLLIVFVNPSLITISMELLIVGYYTLLVISMNINQPIVRGLIVACCLMSRYSLVLWLPLAILVIWHNETKKAFFSTAITIVVFILFIYVLPFLSKDWHIFYNGYKYYDASALGEWEHLDEYTKVPYHLYSGYGFAHVIYQNFPTFSLIEKIKLTQSLHFWASISITILLTLYYLRNRKKIHYRIFLMASFKIYISVFLFFIQVPYLYLMLVDLFVGIAIFAEQSRYYFTTQKDSEVFV